MMENIYKTISQLEAETKNIELYRTLSALSEFAQSVALIKFLREIEDKYGYSIKVIAACPQISENAHWLIKKHRGKIFTLGKWARVHINGVEYMIDTKNISWRDKAYNASPETINEIVEDLRIIYAGLTV